MKFKIIACVNEKLYIGKEGKLLYSIKNDLTNFRRITLNQVVIMGRKTFESLPNGPLDSRINVIITSNQEYNVDSSLNNIYIVHSVEDAIELCTTMFNDRNCYVIGGSSLYNDFIERDVVNEMYITHVNDDTDGDVSFPDVFDSGDWYLFYMSYTQRQRSDEITYKFGIYKRKPI